MKKNLIVALSGVPLIVVIFGGLFLVSYCSIKQDEKAKNYVDNNISLNEATILDIEDIKKSEMADIAMYRFLKLDTNKNGVFDDEDVIVKTTKNLPLEKGKNVIYFEKKESNEKGVVAYKDKNNDYIYNYENFFKSPLINRKIRDKLPEFMTDNKQR